MLQIRIRVENAIKTLTRIQQRFSDFRPLWQNVFEKFTAKTLGQIIASSGRGTWAETQRSNPILIDTEHLFRSYTTPGAPGNVNIQEAKRFTFGSDIFYSIFHEQEDFTIKSNLDRRQVVGIAVDDPEFDNQTSILTDQWAQSMIREIDT